MLQVVDPPPDLGVDVEAGIVVQRPAGESRCPAMRRAMLTLPLDAAFAGCWWSDIPLARLPGWVDTLHSHLQRGARVMVLDNGSVYEVLKNFPPADELRARTAGRASSFEWTAWNHCWAASWTVVA